MTYPPPPPFFAKSLGNSYLLLILAGLLFVCEVSLWFVLHPIFFNLLRLQLFPLFNPEMFNIIIEQWSAEEQSRFVEHYELDMWIHPLLYASTLMSWLTYEASAAGCSPINFFTFLACPVVAAFCDYVENNIQLGMYQGSIPVTNEMVRLGSLAAVIKWSLLSIIGSWCVIKLIRRFISLGVEKHD